MVKPQTTIHVTLAVTSLHQGHVSDLVRGHVLRRHFAERGERVPGSPHSAVALDESVVADDVGLVDGFEDALGGVNEGGVDQGVEEGVEDRERGVEIVVLHFAEEPEEFVDEGGGGEGGGEGVGGGEGEGEVGAAEGGEGAAEGGRVVEEEREEGDVAVEGVGVVRLRGGPGEEACGDEGVIVSVRVRVGEGAEGVGDEGGGEDDEELAAEGVEVGLHGGGSIEEGEDPWDPRGGVSGRRSGDGDVGEVAEGMHHFAGREEGCAERASSCIVVGLY